MFLVHSPNLHSRTLVECKALCSISGSQVFSIINVLVLSLYVQPVLARRYQMETRTQLFLAYVRSRIGTALLFKNEVCQWRQNYDAIGMA